VTANSSASAGPLVIELVGPLWDDGGGFARTLVDVVADRGVELRPGAADQVAGAGVAWALATLLEGHGRGDLLGERAALEGEVVRRWALLGGAGSVRPRSAALAALGRIAGTRPLAVLTGLPGPLGERLAAVIAETVPVDVIQADGPDGLPRPDRITAWLAARGAEPSAATALLGSSPAMLAALAARIGNVCLIGDGGPATAMLAERTAASVELALAG
jgi:hypothetical protein